MPATCPCSASVEVRNCSIFAEGERLHQNLRSHRQKTSTRWTVLPLKTLCMQDGSEISDSMLAALLNRGHLRINSLHNQGIDRVGKGLNAVARDLGGIVQAIEGPSRDFHIGVQWHPELLLYASSQRALFCELVKRVRLECCQ
ncbi:gamma-glutamyl-gamma-aminobutyrate hydrolase family protein [Desulfoplanes sp.]